MTFWGLWKNELQIEQDAGMHVKERKRCKTAARKARYLPISFRLQRQKNQRPRALCDCGFVFFVQSDARVNKLVYICVNQALNTAFRGVVIHAKKLTTNFCLLQINFCMPFTPVVTEYFFANALNRDKGIYPLYTSIK